MHKNIEKICTLTRHNTLVMRLLDGLYSERFETAPILKQLSKASRRLAELKGVASAIPNQGILINTLGLQEVSY